MNVRALAVAVFALSLLVASSTSAQTPYEITTLWPPVTGLSSYPSSFTVVGDAVYFYADLENDTPAIWKWTEADGAKRVRTVVRDYYSSPIYMMALGDKLLFAAQVDSRGTELWITDGTVAGTTIVKDIYEAGSSTPVPMIAVGSTAYFTAYHPDYGRELWKTDGTPAGTSLVKDLTGDSASSYPGSFVESGGRVFFHALDQFFVSDGSEAGTFSLAAGVSQSGAGVHGGRVYFLGSDETHGRELWSTDGTAVGTAMVKDLNPGTASSWGGLWTSFVAAGGGLIFFAEDATNGREPWITDGTDAGTHVVADLTPGPNSSQMDGLVASQAGAFFLTDNSRLWFSDGSEAGTLSLGDLGRVQGLTAASNGAYLATAGNVLTFSDGTPGGTVEIPNVTPNGVPRFTARGAEALFVGTDGVTGFEPWISDGTEAGTRMLVDVDSQPGYGVSVAMMKAVGSKVFFALGPKLFRSDGTAAGTFDVGALNASDSYDADTRYPTAALGADLLYFGGAGETKGLWKSDGTVAGTVPVKTFYDIDTMFASSTGYALVAASVDNPWGYATALWLTRGTTASTVELPVRGGYRFVEVAGRTWFLARRAYYEYSQLWRTDGTVETTQLVLTGDIGGIAVAGGTLYLSQFKTPTGRELWASDGGAEWWLVKDIATGDASSAPEFLGAAGSVLIFTAFDESNGRELWRTDGTAEGTFLLRDIQVGVSSSSFRPVASVGPYVYFIAFDGHAYNLWRTDGTTAGTIRLADAPSSDYPTLWPADVDGTLMFANYDLAHGTELWKSDGTAAETFLAADLIAGAGSSYPSYLTTAADRLFFVTTGRKLWAVDRAATRVTIADERITESDGGTAMLRFTVTRSGDLAGTTQVSYATEDVSATAGADYQPASGTVSFAAGESVKQISVTILGDTVLERNETFALTLPSATGATITRSRAMGLIEENDRRAALSIQLIPKGAYYDEYRTFRISNAGPSAAVVTLHVSESPYEGTFDCDRKNPSICGVGTVGAGQALDFRVARSSSRALADSSFVPGRTITATVSASEPEDDLSDNTIARMIPRQAWLSLPSYLIAGASTTATASSPTGYFPALAQFTLSGGVVVSPSSATVTQASPVASFTVTTASNAWGWSTVRTGTTAVMRIPIVLSAEEVRLDTTIVPPQDYLSFDHDEPVVLPVAVAATLPDGTRPSGTVTLSKADGTVLQVRTVDSGGNATFSVNGLAVGSYQLRVSYGGDEHFAPATVTLPSLYVNGWSTATDLTVNERPCGESEIIVRVRNSDGHTPLGTVNLSIGGTQFNGLALTPTGTPGEASVTKMFAFVSSYYSWVDADYIPNSPFNSSSDYYSLYPTVCPAPTLIASAATATSVSLIWSDVGAAQYEVIRSQAPAPTVFSVVGTTAGTSFVDSTAVAGTSYLYKVNAKSPAGSIRSTSAADLATTVIFSDDPIVFRATRIKAVHITELQQAVNALRTLAGRGAATFRSIAPGSFMQTSDVADLRTAAADALSALGMPAVSWVDGVASGSPVKALHVQQLRNVVK